MLPLFKLIGKSKLRLFGNYSDTPTEIAVDSNGNVQIDIDSMPNAVQQSSFSAKGSVIVGTGANTFGELQIGALGNNAVLVQDSGETTSLKWTKDLSIDGITIANLTASLPVVTDASKVLVSLAYTGATSLRKNLGLEADDSPGFVSATLSGLTASKPVFTDASKALTSSGTLGANQGGTGIVSPTDHSLVVGSGASAMTALGVATDGQLPIGSTGADPVLAALTGTANQVTVTNGAGSITLATPQDIGTGSSPTFVGVNLGDGELTAASINHPTGLTLKIGGTAELSIATGVITVKDGGYLKTDKVRAYDAAGLSLFEDGGKGIFIQDSTGYVGIGTTSPWYPLDIYKSSGIARMRIFSAGSTSGDQASIDLRTGNAQWLLYAPGDANKFQIYDDVNNVFRVTVDNAGNVGINELSPVGKLTIGGTIFLKEQAEADADTAAYGQIWVDTATPNELYFTDDAGTDTQISSHPMDAPKELYTNGPGQDWIGKRVYKLLGIIQWQSLDGKITEETFDEYNLRRKDVAGHHNLVQKNYAEYVAEQRQYWKAAWIDENTAEVFVDKSEAIEAYEVDVAVEEEVVTTDKDGNEVLAKEKVIDHIEPSTKITYELNSTTGIVEPKETLTETPIYETTKEQKWRLKAGCRLDNETGVFYKTVVPTDKDAELAASKDFEDGVPQWMKNRLNI